MATSKEFFEDINKKIVKTNLFTDTAENYVKKFKDTKDTKKIFNHRTKKQEEKIIKNTPTTTQIRKFFNDILVIKQKFENTSNINDEFKRQLPYIKMLKAKVEYSFHRDKVNSAFKNFIIKNIDEIQDVDDFFVFCDFFESIIAYCVKYLKK